MSDLGESVQGANMATADDLPKDLPKIGLPDGDGGIVGTPSKAKSRKRRGGLGSRLFLVLLAFGLVFAALGLSGRPIPMPVFVVAEIEHRANAALAKLIAPFGRFCAIDECGPIDVRLLKPRDEGFSLTRLLGRLRYPAL